MTFTAKVLKEWLNWKDEVEKQPHSNLFRYDPRGHPDVIELVKYALVLTEEKGNSD